MIEPEHDPDWDYEDNECWNCGGEGYTYGCSWDWQCETYDEGEGSCLCTRRCTVCRPVKPDPELQAILSNALNAQGMLRDSAETQSGSGPSGPASPVAKPCAQGDPV